MEFRVECLELRVSGWKLRVGVLGGWVEGFEVGVSALTWV